MRQFGDLLHSVPVYPPLFRDVSKYHRSKVPSIPIVTCGGHPRLFAGKNSLASPTSTAPS